MQTDSTTHYCSPTLTSTSMKQPRKHTDLSGIQKTLLHLCQLLPSLATHFNTSNIEIKQAFSHLWQVTCQWLAMQCFLLTIADVPTSEKSLRLFKALNICQSSCPPALVSPGETASIKVHTVYSDGLNSRKFLYRPQTLQVRPQNCIMVRTKSRLVSQDIFLYHGTRWSQQLHLLGAPSVHRNNTESMIIQWIRVFRATLSLYIN